MAARGFEGYVPEVTLDFFKSSVLPHQPEDIVAKLDGAVASLVDSEQDCWKDLLADSDPKDVTVEDEIEEDEEDSVFAAFPSLLNEIVTHITSVLGRQKEEVTFEVVTSSNERFDSENDVEEDFKVDAFAALRKRTQPLPSTSAADASADENSTKPPSRFSQQAADALFVCALKKGARRKDILRVSLEPVVSHSSLLYD